MVGCHDGVRVRGSLGGCSGFALIVQLVVRAPWSRAGTAAKFAPTNSSHRLGQQRQPCPDCRAVLVVSRAVPLRSGLKRLRVVLPIPQLDKMGFHDGSIVEAS